MNNDKIEQISALMDGAIENDSQRVIDSISNDDESRQTWSRYHIIRDAMQDNLSPINIDNSLADKISASIAAEPTVLAPKPVKQSTFMKPVAGFAIAASVTAAVLVGVQSFQKTDNGLNEVPVAATQVIDSSIAPGLAQTVATNEQEQVNPDLVAPQNTTTSPRLSRYLMNYNELRANSAVQGMPPYVRMIGYEADKK